MVVQRLAIIGTLIACFFLGQCAERQELSPVREEPSNAPGFFRDAAMETGLVFSIDNGRTGSYFFPEITCGGVALFDYDNDSDLDVYLVQGAALHGTLDRQVDGDRLFRNELVETGALRFTDVTAQSGLNARGYGMAATAADMDGDGWVDLYISNFGTDQLWKNRGDGTFENITASAGLSGEGWSVSAAFADTNGNGLLDLYVTQYVDFSVAKNKACLAATGEADYCGPEAYPNLPDLFYKNLGGGRFEDVSLSSGIGLSSGPGLGVIAGDWNADGLTDFYVANDGRANFLWINQGNGRFRDDAVLAGTALNGDGLAEASMGLITGDFDADGDEDLFMTHLHGESNTFYVNDGKGWFKDGSMGAGLATPSRRFTGFGAVSLDQDGDGWLDIAIANGAVSLRGGRDPSQEGAAYPYGQTNQFFRNLGDGRFEDQTARAGGIFSLVRTSRGLAVGDLDNDGDPDLVMTNLHDPVELLLNQRDETVSWLGLDLRLPLAGDASRSALGAIAFVELIDGRRLQRVVRPHHSYVSSSDPRLLFGLGTDQSGLVSGVEILWPDGSTERFGDLATNRYHRILKGAGLP